MAGEAVLVFFKELAPVGLPMFQWIAQNLCKYEKPSDSVGQEKEAINLAGSCGRSILKELRVENNIWP